MPNWCENELLVTGNKVELLKFKMTVEGKNRHGNLQALNEDALIPYPEKYRVRDIAANKIRVAHEKLQKQAKVKKMTDKERNAWFKLHPYPNVKDGFNDGGYEWCTENWGTKWGFCESRISYMTSKSISYLFDTAWSPPAPLIQRMGELFPKLTFRLKYREDGMGFRGTFKMKNGEVEIDECIER